MVRIKALIVESQRLLDQVARFPSGPFTIGAFLFFLLFGFNDGDLKLKRTNGYHSGT